MGLIGVSTKEIPDKEKAALDTALRAKAAETLALSGGTPTAKEIEHATKLTALADAVAEPKATFEGPAYDALLELHGTTREKVARAGMG